MTNSGPKICWDRDDRLSQVHQVIHPPLLSGCCGVQVHSDRKDCVAFELCSHTGQSKREVWRAYAPVPLKCTRLVHQTSLSLYFLKNHCLWFSFSFGWPFITCQPWMIPSPNNLCLKKSCMGAGVLWVGRVVTEPILSNLLCAPAQEAENDTQTLVLLLWPWTNSYFSGLGRLSLNQMFPSCCHLPRDL